MANDTSISGVAATTFDAIFGRGAADAVLDALGLDRTMATPGPLERFGTVPGGSYTAKSGDSLSGIAAQHGTTWQTLARINGIADPNKIAVGQHVRLPAGSSTTHIVQRGDTLAAIASSNGTTVQGLMRSNPQLKNANRIYPGDVIQIAGLAKVSTGNPAATGGLQSTASDVGTSRTPSDGRLSEAGMQFIYNHEAQQGVSNRLHWPKAASGVTLGPGYDMKGKSQDQIVRDLTAIGISPTVAARAGQGAGLTGQQASSFARANRDLINLTPAQEKALLQNTVKSYADFVATQIKVPVSQGQFDALVSFAYNIGKTGFADSTALKRLNAGNHQGVPEAMSWWNKSDGKVNQGLINRRTDEMQLFRSAGERSLRPLAAGSTAEARFSPSAGLRGGSAQSYVNHINAVGDAQAKADLNSGKKVVVAVRTETSAFANNRKGNYDDTIAVVWKNSDGSYSAREFRGNTDPSAQYAFDGRRPLGRDVNGDGSIDQGRLVTGNYRYVNEGYSSLYKNTYFRAARTQVAERDTNHDGRFDSRDTNRIDQTGAGTSMLFHQGGVNNTGSAGCQTLAPNEFNAVLRLLGNQKSFSYVLTNNS